LVPNLLTFTKLLVGRSYLKEKSDRLIETTQLLKSITAE